MAFLDSDPLAWSTFGANDKPKRGNAGESEQDNNIPINTDEDGNNTANSWRQQATSAKNAGVQELADTPRAESMSVLDHAKNTAMQTNRFLPGVAQGFLKMFAAPGIALESLPQGIKETLHIGGAQRPMMMPDGSRLYGSANSMGKPITEGAKALNSGIQSYTDSFVPAPMSEVARFTATVADAAGEAVPTAAAAAMTGGASAVLTGTALSYGLAGANGFSTEMLEGSGDPIQALIAGGVESGTEALGGMAAKHGGKVLSRISDSPIGEGAEEVLSGFAQSKFGGERYTAAQAGEDFLLGATVGGLFEGANAAAKQINTARISNAVNSRIESIANADVNDVQSLIDRGGESPANAIVAHDSLEALQKQVANPIKTTPRIDSDIAQRFNLIPAREGSSARPVKVNAQSYENRVAPLVADLTVPEISAEIRASANPNEATEINPRALYQYAPDVYLRPGTDVDSSSFTHRGQENRFYRTSQELGAILASGVGTSWEGSGVYSAPDTFTADLYGPSRRLPDNPLSNRGIPQKSVDVDYPIGVILQQPSALTEDISPLTRKDAPNDAVQSGTRRIRYDNAGRGFTTEIINNPADISAAGLIFGRTGVADSTPVQYSEDTPQLRNETESTDISDVGSNDSIQDYALDQRVEQPASRRTASEPNAENAPIEYVMPDIIKASEASSGYHYDHESIKPESLPRSETVAESASIDAQPTLESQSDFESVFFESAFETEPVPESVPELTFNPNSSSKESGRPEKSHETIHPKGSESQQSQSNSTAAAQDQAHEPLRIRKKEKNEQSNSSLMGSGATGEVYESTAYNLTFGAGILSSN